MKHSEFDSYKTSSPEAFQEFLGHLSGQGKFRFIVLRVLFRISFFSIVRHIPIIGSISDSVKNLFIGYLVESRQTPLPLTKHLEKTIPFCDFSKILGIYDYIIVGSGPGAAVAINKLPSDSTVLVVEQGDIPKTSQEFHHTLQHVTNDFHKAGQEIAISPWMPQFTQASVFGGGSEVNSGLYHDLPRHLLEKFTESSKLSAKVYLESETKIRDLLQLSEMPVSYKNSLIARGADAMGLEFKNIPRWRTYDENGHFVQHGMNDLIWSKKSRLGLQHNLKESKAISLDTSSRSQIIVRVQNANFGLMELRCKQLILAAGTIQTPYLLCKSGILNWNKTSFQWHPMLRTVVQTAITDLGANDVDPYQAWTKNKDFKFGSAVSTPGLLGMNLGRVLNREELEGLRSIYVSFVSSGKGGLIPQTDIPWYLPSKLDKNNATESRKLLAELLRAGGADEVKNNKKRNVSLSTVHIFGSLPIDSGIFIDGTTRMKVDPRIQISDGSILPFGPGVNPQGVIMSLCDAIVTG